VTIPLIVAAAFLLGLGFVLQQRAAQEAPPDELLSYRLLLDLMHKPVWLAGIASMASGQVLSAIALGRADITLVEPLLTANVLFALLLARALSAQSLGRREWIGALMLVLGIALFIGAGDPRDGDNTSLRTAQGWLVVLGIAALAGLLVAIARRREGTEKATLLAAAAGALFGLQDGFTRRAMILLDKGVLHLLVAWQTYAVLTVAVIGILLAQSAFEAAPLRASLPAMTVAEPLCGMAFGVGAFGEVVRVAPVWLGLESGGLLAMVTGVIMLARSPHLHHQLTPSTASPPC
jgi:drug/metabolite transporter (DMT)-like permease